VCSRATPQVDVTDTFFDQRALDYERAYTELTAGGYALRVRREKVLSLFDQPGGKVLDVGCGPGILAQQMVDRACAYTGVDPSKKMLEICRRRFAGNPQMQFLSGEATGLAFPTAHFDAALCIGVIDGVPDQRQALREILRVLKPGGTLLITFTNAVSPYSWWKKYVYYPAVTQIQALSGHPLNNGRRKISPPDAKGRTLYNKSDACDFLRSEGAQVSRILGYYFNIFLSPLDELFPSVALSVTRRLEEGSWPAPEWVASGWIVKAKKINASAENS
jgi:ubiquinone/menaquinone biosynthesis C-methylase UbiE